MSEGFEDYDDEPPSTKDELKLLYQRIENEKIIVNRVLDDIQKQIDGHDKYLQSMTTFCAIVSVIIIINHYSEMRDYLLNFF